MGIALGGLAAIDPVITDGSVTAQAVMLGTILGSQAPDIDTILKLKNNAVYIRNHRGITHSLPAVLLWPILISGFIFTLFPATNLLHLWLISCIRGSRAIGERSLHARQVQARNNSPPLPSDFPPEISERATSFLVSPSHQRVVVIEHEYFRWLRFAHG